MEKLIYIYPARLTFVQKDIDFLANNYKVVTQDLDWERKVKLPINLILQFIFLLKNQGSAKSTLVMFGGYWSLLPVILCKLFGKKCFVILGGTECVSIPEVNYGSLRKKVLKKVIGISLKHAHMLLPVHESLIAVENKYTLSISSSKQGVYNHFSGLKTPYKTIYNGFDATKFEPLKEVVKKTGSFIALASVGSYDRFILKGLDKVFTLAQNLPENMFTIIGVKDSVVEQLDFVPPNVSVFPFLEIEKFKSYLWSSEFILQLSVSEGFPNALAEGMLCKCIPIGSSVGAIPFIIGDTGCTIETNDDSYLLSEISRLLSLCPEVKKTMSENARDRILSNFELKKRKQQFLEIIN